MLALTCAAPTPGIREKRPWHSGRLNGQNRDQGLDENPLDNGNVCVTINGWSKSWNISTRMAAAWDDDGWLGLAREGAAIGFVALLIPGYFLVRQLAGAGHVSFDDELRHGNPQ